jgi:hypothetical protein
MPKQKKSTIKSELPKGYTSISSGNSWRPEKAGEQVEGVYLGFKVVHQEKRGKMKARDVNVHRIQTSTGVVEVWQSAGLKALESVKKNSKILIRMIGKRVITRGQNPMREFIIGTK